MKKITILAIFLGTTYFSNAQVGIGTSTPASSSQLEISSINKGVLIPRVELTSTTVFSPVIGTEIESLLVYNTKTEGNVTPGFYYWVKQGAVAAHWERIVNQTQLDEAISNIANVQADLGKVLALLNVAFPSNNLIDSGKTGETHGGGMVYTPGNGTTTESKLEYVYFDATTNTYMKKDITNDIKNFIKGAESKTTFIEYPVGSGKYYYISEQTIIANGGIVPTSPFTTGTTLRPGTILIDVPQSVINNFKTILEGTTTILKPGTTNQYYTVEEYIKYISQNSMQDGATKIVINNGVAELQQWNNSTNTWVSVANTVFEKIVTDNETKTSIGKSINNSDYVQVVVDPKNTQKIVYEYLTENADVKNYIDVTSDVEWSIKNNTNIKNVLEEIINNLLNQGGNVYFTRTEIVGGTPTGQQAIPAFSFYTINPTTKVKELVDIAQTIVNAITNATTEQKQKIKNQLGDQYSVTTIINTGNTWIDGNKIFKGVYKAVINKGTADLKTPINLNAPTDKTGKVIGITILDNDQNIINVATTDVIVTTTGTGSLSFKIGTGDMYSVLDALADKNINVIVEFSVAE